MTGRDGHEVDTILKKGKLNQEGIKVVKMNEKEKKDEIKRALKQMIRDKQTRKIEGKKLEREQDRINRREMYLDECPQLT